MIAGRLRRFVFLVLGFALAAQPGRAISLADYARTHPVKLFVAQKGAVMPNEYDSPGHLQLGTKALLLSGLDLTDLDGILDLVPGFVRDQARGETA